MTRVLAVLLVLLVTSVAQAATPPATGPTGLNQRPRLIVTQANRAAILAYIHANYATQFQTWIDKFDDAYPVPNVADTVDHYGATVQVWGPANYGLVAALGVANVKALGYTIPAMFDDADPNVVATNLCSKGYDLVALPYTSYDPAGSLPSVLSLIPRMNNTTIKADYAVGAALQRINDTKVYTLPTSLFYDWCQPYLTVAQKQAIADAFWSNHQYRWGTYTLTGLLGHLAYPVVETDQLTSERCTPRWDDLIFALAVWGDTDVLDATNRQRYFDSFYQIAINRQLFEYDTLYPEGFWDSAGADYYGYGYSPMIPFTLMAIETALGGPTSLVADRPYMKEWALAHFTWHLPEQGVSTATCGTGGGTNCTRVGEKWGWNTYGVGDFSCYGSTAVSGMQRFLALEFNARGLTTLRDHYQAQAAIAEWGLNTFWRRTCPDAATWDVNPWALNLFYRFLFGVDGMPTPQTPTTLHQTLGGQNYFFRSGFDTSATHIWVSGVNRTLSHDTSDHGTITVGKNGNLIMSAGTDRSGNCVVQRSRADAHKNILKSSVGIHTGTSDTTLNADSVGTADPIFTARGITSYFYITALPSKDSSSADYSYVFTDQNPIWNQASVMQREVTYLHGSTDHEYLIVLDRANVADVANDPILKWWVPTQPACVDATCQEGEFVGKWTTTGKVVSVTNQIPAYSWRYLGLTGTTYQMYFPATNGKVFMKAILPADVYVQILGDDGTGTRRYHDGNAAGIMIPYEPDPDYYEGCHFDASKRQLGWGRIEMRPTTVQTVNTFLTVIQIGEATSLTSMSDTQQARAWGDGEWIVAHIADAVQDRLVTYAKDASEGQRASRLGYQYAQRTPTAFHLLTDLAPGQTYYTAVERARLALVGPVSVIALPFGLLPFFRRRTVLIVLVLVAGVVGGRWLAVQPVTLTVDVSTSPNGGVPRVADTAGVISFEVTR